ncbi:MAG: HAD-IA family hydrolase [Bradyrhizobium sp.]|uniref:HAD-IA family hydrolase n=1 Tax=Bradyrhizobium sp. TaxID=376 RepID=UPI001DF55EEF|nr:HAD-IA family hydrolase [Bradyrhizobium sp.]MBV9563692.1 HAD-IA family hydrolase [Bradyrhizobium sp.]
MSSSRLSPGDADALLFDLGRVVLDIDFGKALSCWAGHAGCAPADIAARFIRDEAYRQHETGKISDAEYFRSLRSALRIELSDAQFLEGWNAIFAGEMPDIATLLPRAARHLPLYAFSNTNRPHVAYFSQAHGDVLGHFREVYLSSTIGLRKPDAEAYDHVVQAIGVPASRIVFFDDSLENVEGARACGLKVVHVRSSADVADALAALGI